MDGSVYITVCHVTYFSRNDCTSLVIGRTASKGMMMIQIGATNERGIGNGQRGESDEKCDEREKQLEAVFTHQTMPTAMQ